MINKNLSGATSFQIEIQNISIGNGQWVPLVKEWVKNVVLQRAKNQFLPEKNGAQIGPK